MSEEQTTTAPLGVKILKNALYVPRQLIPVLIFRDTVLANGGFGEMLKSIIELRTLRIDPLVSGRILSDSSPPSYRAHQQTPTFYFSERFGKQVTDVLTDWSSRVEQGFDKGVDLLLIEPDITHTHALDAWRFTNVRPLSWTLSHPGRDVLKIMPDAELLRLVLTGETQQGLSVMIAASDEMKKLSGNPYSAHQQLEKSPP